MLLFFLFAIVFCCLKRKTTQQYKQLQTLKTLVLYGSWVSVSWPLQRDPFGVTEPLNEQCDFLPFLQNSFNKVLHYISCCVYITECKRTESRS